MTLPDQAQHACRPQRCSSGGGHLKGRPRKGALKHQMLSLTSLLSAKQSRELLPLRTQACP